MKKQWIPPAEVWGDKKWAYDPERKVFRKEEELIATGKEGIPYKEALDMLGLKSPEPTPEEEQKKEETWQERKDAGIWEKGDPFPPEGHDMQGEWVGIDEWKKAWGPGGTEAKKYDSKKK